MAIPKTSFLTRGDATELNRLVDETRYADQKLESAKREFNTAKIRLNDYFTRLQLPPKEV